MMPTPPDEESSWDSIQEDLGLKGAQASPPPTFSSTPAPAPLPAPTPAPISALREEDDFGSDLDDAAEDESDEFEADPDTLVDEDDGFAVDAVALDPDDADDGPEMLDAPSEVIDVDGDDEEESPSEVFDSLLEGAEEETAGASAEGGSDGAPVGDGTGKKKRRRRRRKKKKNGGATPTEGATAEAVASESPTEEANSDDEDDDNEFEDADDESTQLDEALPAASVAPLPDMKLVSWSDLVAGLYRP